MEKSIPTSRIKKKFVKLLSSIYTKEKKKNSIVVPKYILCMLLSSGSFITFNYRSININDISTRDNNYHCNNCHHWIIVSLKHILSHDFFFFINNGDVCIDYFGTWSTDCVIILYIQIEKYIFSFCMKRIKQKARV